VLNVTRTPEAVPAPVPVTTTVWVTACPATAPNGVDVSAGTRSTPSAGARATGGPASAHARPATLSARDRNTSVL
jgi:hypothetical protein